MIRGEEGVPVILTILRVGDTSIQLTSRLFVDACST